MAFDELKEQESNDVGIDKRRLTLVSSYLFTVDCLNTDQGSPLEIYTVQI